MTRLTREWIASTPSLTLRAAVIAFRAIPWMREVRVAVEAELEKRAKAAEAPASPVYTTSGSQEVN